ncbi:unnamed protein product, partial [Ostreobium quekettii]
MATDGGEGAPEAPATRSGARPLPPARPPAPESVEGSRRKAFNARFAAMRKDFFGRKRARMTSEIEAAHVAIAALVERVGSALRERPTAPLSASAQSEPGDDKRAGRSKSG